jgi:hypothetical protein
MDDFEITSRCYAAMFNDNLRGPYYDPLHDDAQAMALVKKFRIDINSQGIDGTWEIRRPITPVFYGKGNKDLNRAICECVANMQATRTTKS